MITTIWFIVLGTMLTVYAVLDGFDIGVGLVHLFVGRSRDERELTIGAIGPVWNGNEVWLIAAGGAMVVAYPHLYAAAFSGFYLALMLVLWLLVLRGVAIEFRHQVDNALWQDAWDVVFAGASALLAVLFGAAVGNVLRGVPLDAQGDFTGSFVLLLNPFALLCSGLALAALAMHGSAYLVVKTSGPVQERARRAVRPLWVLTLLLLAAVTLASVGVHPGFAANFARWPFLLVFPLAGIAAAVSLPRALRRGEERRTFAATSTLVASIVASAGAGLYPTLLPALAGSSHPGLDIHNTASATSSQAIALGVYLVGMAIVVAYLVRVYRIWRGKVDAGHAYHP